MISNYIIIYHIISLYYINVSTFLKRCFDTRSARHLGASTEVQGGVDDHHGASQNHLEPLSAVGNPKNMGLVKHGKHGLEKYGENIFGGLDLSIAIRGNHIEKSIYIYLYGKIPIAMEV